MRLLDLFCCEGGAGTGYSQAGFEVVGVDIEARAGRYPFEFIQADALDVLGDDAFLATFDAIHASPPCQSYSKAFKHMATPQPMLIDPVRAQLQRIGKPWIIENVEGAPIGAQDDLFGSYGALLCGTSFGLRVYRHRLFEASFPITGTTCAHTWPAMNPHNQEGRERIYAEHGRGDPEVIWRREMGVAWMTKNGGRESIPPAFTEHLGKQLLTVIAGEAAA
jgi:DNA (cytosine-5)-methyltransferase 1